jgi:cytochrome c oxidase subunit 2
LFGKEEQLEGGRTVIVDADYILKSLREPNADIVKGYAPVMPVLSEKQLSTEHVGLLIDFIKQQK